MVVVGLKEVLRGVVYQHCPLFISTACFYAFSILNSIFSVNHLLRQLVALSSVLLNSEGVRILWMTPSTEIEMISLGFGPAAQSSVL